MKTEHIHNNADQIVRILKVLSSQNRLDILCAINNDEKCVGELERAVDLSQSALSQHLAKLRREDIVKTRREAQTIYYSLADQRVKQILNAIVDVIAEDNMNSMADITAAMMMSESASERL